MSGLIIDCDSVVNQIYDLLKQNYPYSLKEFDVPLFIEDIVEFINCQYSINSIKDNLTFTEMLSDTVKQDLFLILKFELTHIRKMVFDTYMDYNQEEYDIEIECTYDISQITIYRRE